MDKIQDLKQKVQDFNMLKLPGQPMMMHMGTSYLVNDLWKRIAELGEAIEEAISSEHDECKVILNKAIGDQEQGDEM